MSFDFCAIMETEINAVQILLKNNSLTLEEKLLIKNSGRPTPDLQINCTSTSKTRTYSRVFNRNIYFKYEWMCGCPIINKLFCFVCLLFKQEVSAWTRQGVDDLKHVAERAKKHENSGAHMNACVDFNVLGKISIRKQLTAAYLQHKLKCNEEVEKNRHILRRLIMCIKFSGAFELVLRSHDAESSSGTYVGLINFAAELDSVLAIHLRDSKVFNGEGVSKAIQNELLDAMLEIYKQEVIKEIDSANFIALEADETVDSSNQLQIVIITRYVFNRKICERFWSFIKPARYTADEVAKALLQELKVILPMNSYSDYSKLIAQSYNGASMMSDRYDGVQAIIKRTFPHAHFVHCYAYQFSLLTERAAQCHKAVKIFFANLQAFASFFSRSPKRIALFEDVVKRQLPRAAPIQWDFKTRKINTLFEYRDSFKDCLERIINEDEVDPNTMSEASCMLNHLNCPEFLYWLKMFHFIMPHVEIFFNQAQVSGIESFEVQNAVDIFQQKITRIRSITDSDSKDQGRVIKEEPSEEPHAKKRKVPSAEENRSIVAKEVCDTILTQIQDRFDFRDHLSAANLLDPRNFKTYKKAFPQNHLDCTAKSYPMLDVVKLKCELSTIYERDDMYDAGGVLSLLVFISDNNLKKVFTETYKLLDIICTTPMSTSERERCFSTLNRIKTFLKTTMSEDRLNVLAVLSIEKKFIQSIPDFDNKVIESFCNKANRRADFMYQ